MRHDPEHTAAAYLAGELARRGRARFEQHLLDCENCWRETNAARTGRLLGESLREAAPPSVRERIRGLAALPPPRPQPSRPAPLWWPYLLAGTAATVAVLLVILTPWNTPTQPAPLTAAADLYRTGAPAASAEANPPMRTIAGYAWQGTTLGELVGIPATIHTYTDAAGQRLLVISSPHRFPRALDAREITPAPSWIATIDGTAMLCADQPGTSWLAIAATPDDALTAGRALGLTRD